MKALNKHFTFKRDDHKLIAFTLYFQKKRLHVIDFLYERNVCEVHGEMDSRNNPCTCWTILRRRYT